MNLYEVAILSMPKDDKGKVKTAEAKIVLMERVLATSEQGAVMKVSRMVTDGEIENWDEVEVKVRPF